MLERLKSAIPLIILFLLAFILPEPYCGIVFLLLAGAALYFGVQEAFAMLNVHEGKSYCRCTQLFAILGCIGFFCCKHGLRLDSEVMLGAICTLYLLCIFFVMFRYGVSRDNVIAMMVSTGVFFYINWTMFSAIRLYYLPCSNGTNLLLFLALITKMGDVGAYFAGSTTHRLVGKTHKLAPTVSPGKSWEGLVGGMVFSAGTGLFIYYVTPGLISPHSLCTPGFTPCVLIILGIVAAVIGLLGDLAESALKRSANVKDSGHLPGIGGILDILDSLTLMAPLFYFLCKFMENR